MHTQKEKKKCFLRQKETVEAFLKIKACLWLPKCWFLPPTSGNCIRLGETWAEEKCTHLSSHKTSVFHRGNGQVSPLTGFVNSYWGLWVSGGKCQNALWTGTGGDLTLPWEGTASTPKRPWVSRRQRWREGWVTTGRPQSHARGQDSTTPSTAPEGCNETGFRPPEHQGVFSSPRIISHGLLNNDFGDQFRCYWA